MNTLKYNKTQLNALISIYLITKTLKEVVHDLIKNIKEEILLENVFVSGKKIEVLGIDKGTRILDADDSCLICETDAQRFYKLIYEKEKKYGIATKGIGYAAEYPYDELFRCAANMLLEFLFTTLEENGETEMAKQFRENQKNIIMRKRMISIILKFPCGKLKIPDFT